MACMKRICKKCGTEVKHYDRVKRVVRGKGGKKYHIWLDRYICPNCGEIHRELPEDILPYKQYESEIIHGVVEGLIDEETYGFEDFPSSMTMHRWRNEEKNVFIFPYSSTEVVLIKCY